MGVKKEPDLPVYIFATPKEVYCAVCNAWEPIVSEAFMRAWIHMASENHQMKLNVHQTPLKWRTVQKFKILPDREAVLKSLNSM